MLAIEMVNSPHFRGYNRAGYEHTRGKPDWREQVDIGPERPALPFDPEAPPRPSPELAGLQAREDHSLDVRAPGEEFSDLDRVLILLAESQRQRLEPLDQPERIERRARRADVAQKFDARATHRRSALAASPLRSKSRRDRPRPVADAYPKGGYGALVGFELKGGVEAGRKFIDSLELLYHVANIGARARSPFIRPRPPIRWTTPALLSIGGAILLAALVWWWITYGEVVNYGYLSWREAGACLVGNSDICALAKALCFGAHPRLMITYWSSSFWIGLAVLAASLLTAGGARAVE
jgi:hypothetical protein